MVKVNQGAILAAGRGERLRASGETVPKALARVCGEPLLARQARLMIQLDIERVYAVVNHETFGLIDRLRINLPPGLVLDVSDTANSMETMFRFARFLKPGFFLAITVDAVLSTRSFKNFFTEATAKLSTPKNYLAPEGPPRLLTVRGAAGITRWQGDPNPLFAQVSDEGEIVAFEADSERWVTAGVFLLHTDVFTLISDARNSGLKALREFLALGVRKGWKLHAIRIEDAVDVDEKTDLQRAEKMLLAAHEGCRL